MTTQAETRKTPGCVFSQPYTDYDGSSGFADCPDPATWLVWLPTHDEHEAPPYGTVLGACGEHVATIQTEDPVSEIVRIAGLSIICSSCHEPVWAKHAEGHARIPADECPDCKGLAERRAAAGIDIPTVAEHARCSSPEYAAYLKAMGEEES